MSEAAAPPKAAVTDQLVLRLDGFEGPLDLLLTLARAQKIDLTHISILALAEQYLAVINSAQKLQLELAAEWLVMAAWLAWLKSRLLLPSDSDESADAEESADALAGHLVELNAMRAATLWLGTCPQLGREVFVRGAPESFLIIDRSELRLELSGLLLAYLGASRRANRAAHYRPPHHHLWTVEQALARLQRLLSKLPDWTELAHFLPKRSTDPIEARAALASTLIASLELARAGALRLRQESAFGPILLGEARHLA